MSRTINQLNTVNTPGVIQPTKQFVIPIQQPNPALPKPEGEPLQIDVQALIALMQLEKVANKTEAEMVAAGPIATALQAKANLQAVLDLLAGKADLVGGLINVNQIPAIAIVEFLGNKANEAAMLATVGQKGDWVIRTDLTRVYVITGNDPTQLASWTALAYPVGGTPNWGSIVGDISSQLDLIALIEDIITSYTIHFDGATIIGTGTAEDKYRVNPDVLGGGGGGGGDTVDILARGSQTNQASVTISLDYDGYRYFEIILEAVRPVSDSKNLHVNFSADGVAFDDGAAHYDWFRKMDSDKRAGVNGADTALVLCESQGSSSPGSGKLEIYGATNAAVPTRLISSLGYPLPNAEFSEWYADLKGRRKANVVTKAVRLTYHDGTALDCTYIVRGIKN